MRKLALSITAVMVLAMVLIYAISGENKVYYYFVEGHDLITGNSSLKVWQGTKDQVFAERGFSGVMHIAYSYEEDYLLVEWDEEQTDRIETISVIVEGQEYEGLREGEGHGRFQFEVADLKSRRTPFEIGLKVNGNLLEKPLLLSLTTPVEDLAQIGTMKKVGDVGLIFVPDQVHGEVYILPVHSPTHDLKGISLAEVYGIDNEGQSQVLVSNDGYYQDRRFLLPENIEKIVVEEVRVEYEAKRDWTMDLKTVEQGPIIISDAEFELLGHNLYLESASYNADLERVSLTIRSPIDLETSYLSSVRFEAPFNGYGSSQKEGMMRISLQYQPVKVNDLKRFTLPFDGGEITYFGNWAYEVLD